MDRGAMDAGRVDDGRGPRNRGLSADLPLGGTPASRGWQPTRYSALLYFTLTNTLRNRFHLNLTVFTKSPPLSCGALQG